MMAHAQHVNMEAAIKDVTECHKVCLETLNYCLSMGGEHAREEHIKTLLDCINMCETMANFMIRDSQFHDDLAGTCAKACEVCAISCDQFSDNDQMMKCADVCRKCAMTCREMAAVPVV